MFHKIYVLQVSNKTGIHLIFTRYLHPSLHLIFFSICAASFQQQLIRKQNKGATSFLKSLHPSLHLIFISILFYYILIAVCVCVCKKNIALYMPPPFFPFLLRVQGLLLKTQKPIYLFILKLSCSLSSQWLSYIGIQNANCVMLVKLLPIKY